MNHVKDFKHVVTVNIYEKTLHRVLAVYLINGKRKVQCNAGSVGRKKKQRGKRNRAKINNEKVNIVSFFQTTNDLLVVSMKSGVNRSSIHNV